MHYRILWAGQVLRCSYGHVMLSGDRHLASVLEVSSTFIPRTRMPPPRGLGQVFYYRFLLVDVFEQLNSMP